MKNQLQRPVMDSTRFSFNWVKRPLFFLLLLLAGYHLITAFTYKKQVSNLDFVIVNNSSYPDADLYWTVVCQDSFGLYCYMDPNGNLTQMDSTDNNTVVGTVKNCKDTSLFANYSYKYSDYGSISIPDDAYINSAILYLSVGDFLPICVNSDSLGYAPPSYSNPSLQGYDMIIQAVEFAYNINKLKTLNVNTTNVDEVGLAVKLILKDGSGQDTVGFTTTRDSLITLFESCTDTSFNHLVIPSSSGQDTLRIISPEHVTSNLGLDSTVTAYFEDFYTSYIDSCWSFYEGKTLQVFINSEGFTGKLTNGIFSFTPNDTTDATGTFTFTKPTSDEVMSANGQFILPPTDKQNVGKQIATAMYRTVFMETSNSHKDSWCSNTMKNKYFTNAPINHYGLILHENSIHGLCYAYGYSDVCSESPSLASTTTSELKIIITN